MMKQKKSFIKVLPGLTSKYFPEKILLERFVIFSSSSFTEEPNKLECLAPANISKEA